MKWILICVIMLKTAGPYTNSSVVMQEFDSEAQCRYAATLISERIVKEQYNTPRKNYFECIYK